ncbi:MAG: MoxR family ATPase [Spirochaetales bacterium]|nr:MoxR family ATPase [Spirochaetales bacterium]
MMRTKPMQKETGMLNNQIDKDFTAQVKEQTTKLIDNIRSVIFVDRKKLEYIIASRIAGGHVMLADSHGVGKTSLAKALAGSIEWEETELKLDDVRIEQFSRIQCTVDLLPQDILGFTRFDSKGEYFVFNKGPIFAHFVLCDEINLLTPKTQGSFFQAMEEQMVTIEGNTYRLPGTFFIIATMNLKGAHLFPLPAPQLDRFMLQVSLGFPKAEEEADIIKMHGRNDAWKDFKPVIRSDQLTTWQGLVDRVFIHDDIIDYMVSCINRTRAHQDILMGASPRTGVKLSRLARALSMIRGEEYVSIDTVKEIFIPVVAHRLVLYDPSSNSEGVQKSEEILDHILKSVPVDK